MSEGKVTENSTVEVEIEPTADDYRRVLYWFHKTRVTLTLVAFGFFLLIALTSVVVTLPYLLSLKNRTALVGAIFPLIPALLVGLVLTLLIFQIRKSAKTTVAASEPTKYSFSSEGVEAVSNSGTVRVDWNRYKRVEETKTDFVFFPQDNLFTAVPKRFFDDDLEIDVLRRIISENFTGRLRLLAE